MYMHMNGAILQALELSLQILLLHLVLVQVQYHNLQVMSLVLFLVVILKMLLHGIIQQDGVQNIQHQHLQLQQQWLI